MQPGEVMVDNKAKKRYLLEENEALLLRAKLAVEVETQSKNEETGEIYTKKVKYEPGDKWLQHGPCSYVPPIEVEILEQRAKIPLDKNEGFLSFFDN